MNKHKLFKTSFAVITGLLATTLFTSAIVATEVNSSANSRINANSSLGTGVDGNSSTTNYQSSDALMMQSGIMGGGNGTVSLPSNINTSADLLAYQDSLMTKDGAIEEINTTKDDEISVVWNQKGKLFAIFPITVGTETIVKAKSDNEVDISTNMPWWNIFVTGIKNISSDTEMKLEQSNEIKAYAIAKTNAQAKAQVVYTIVSELKAHAEANIDVKANLNSEVAQ